MYYFYLIYSIGITSVCSRKDGKYILSSGKDSKIYIHDIRKNGNSYVQCFKGLIINLITHNIEF